MKKGEDVGVSCYDMWITIARARLAECPLMARADIDIFLRSLDLAGLNQEYQRAVATLATRNLLTRKERDKADEYLREWKHDQSQSLPL